MLDFYDGYGYVARAAMTWLTMREPVTYLADVRDIDAGYCLDALEHVPAGATVRTAPKYEYDNPPFATARLTWRFG